MQNVKFYLQNLQSQINILIGFYLENEALLSHQLIQKMDQALFDLNDLLSIKAEIDKKVELFTIIETIANNPRYFMANRPKELVEVYAQKKEFRKLSPGLNTFLAYANILAKEMLQANQNLIENLPPFYQGIIIQSKKNKQNGFSNVLIKLVHQTPYPKTLAAEYIRITTLISESTKSRQSFQFLLTSLNQPVNQ